MSYWARRIIWFERALGALLGIGFSLIWGISGNLLSQPSMLFLLPLLVAVVVSLAVVIVILRRLRPAHAIVHFKLPQILTEKNRPVYFARRALVCFVPLYTPKRGCPADSLSREARRAAVAALDFAGLCVEESNLWPTICAILAHRTKLKHCWLLTTESDADADSRLYARLLAEYLTQRKGMDCRFYYGDRYAIPLKKEDDALLFSRTYDMVGQVLTEAHGKKLAAKDIVADITSGVRSMTIGMILACLGADQDIEVVGTHYDENGQPTKDLFPFIVSFAPQLERPS
ncbi:MAG: hypothetical protein M3Z04_16175 [Chloroflexota bacterium]|nr:hypothetical protein [Chloroflexota bacterium]